MRPDGGSGGRKTMHCAIYTRVSSDAGLEQDFNSLDAQREAAEAFVRSQTHEGWKLLRGQYNDGGYSGGTMDRPALQSLLADIRAGRVDIVVVYKVDRLTRSLADFAKLVELFDAHEVSFVSVTQAFNTTTSMGRLTLNVLLSFAQFEREVTGERIRDKIAASKKKGLWMGGVVPLGYRVEDRKLLIDPEEARIVRLIFETYTELKSLPKLQQFLKDRGIRSRVRKMSDGRTIGGIPLSNGPLAVILRNRMYLGEINHRDQSYPGEHEPLIDRDLFDRVQAILTANQSHTREKYTSSNMLLKGKVYDDRSNRMSPNFAVKKGVRYRYYLSRTIVQGDRTSAGSAPRVPALQVEEIVRSAIATMFPSQTRYSQTKFTDATPQDRDKRIRALIERVIISADAIEIRTTKDIPNQARQPGRINIASNDDKDEAPTIIDPNTLRILWSGPAKNPRKDILVPAGSDRTHARPIRAQPRAKLILAIAKARRWVQHITSGASDIETIARAEGCSIKHVRTNLTLAFLDPMIIQAAIAGRLPRGYGITRLADLPGDWSEQRMALGL